MYEAMETCPEELLLFFHHVPYQYRLKSGKTLIQHIYDSHFEGAMRAQEMLEQFRRLDFPYQRNVMSIVFPPFLRCSRLLRKQLPAGAGFLPHRLFLYLIKQPD